MSYSIAAEGDCDSKVYRWQAAPYGPFASDFDQRIRWHVHGTVTETGHPPQRVDRWIISDQSAKGGYRRWVADSSTGPWREVRVRGTLLDKVSVAPQAFCPRLGVPLLEPPLPKHVSSPGETETDGVSVMRLHILGDQGGDVVDDTNLYIDPTTLRWVRYEFTQSVGKNQVHGKSSYRASVNYSSLGVPVRVVLPAQSMRR